MKNNRGGLLCTTTCITQNIQCAYYSSTVLILSVHNEYIQRYYRQMLAKNTEE